ncbi:TetR/AcrR family transcriptional regulator [Gilvimarinus polysaccharolyticus]|uniref:TetR/AcrR family transcriptional regulator n=1 Tax=Gilvimarinus polysaccharolyticus TaxID=863921 RepID=UPI000673B94B|nr:TetR/AcrR family transcriptional regulator [Gilvimarinus polysaccharolyticus]
MSSKTPTGRKPASDKKAGYHHGNLREALLERAMQILQHESIDNLSLRALAKDLGVSATAVYSHFTDKTDLLIDLRTQGFHLLNNALLDTLAHASNETAEQKVRLLGHTYMQFGRQYPNLFDTLFTWTPELERIKPDCIEAGANCEGTLHDTLCDMLAEYGVTAGDYRASVASMSTWSLVHGMTMLVRSGAIEGAVHCGHWPVSFSASQPEQQTKMFNHLISIELAGLKACINSINEH